MSPPGEAAAAAGEHALDGRDFRPGLGGLSYREQPWIRGQYAGFSDPKDTNARIRTLVAKGQRGVGIALDLPTQLGLDADHPGATGEVGRVGVSIGSLDDLDALLEGIPLDSVSQFSTTANSIGPQMIAMWCALAIRRGVDPNTFSVRLQNDVLKEYVARGTQVLPPDAAAELTTDAVEHCVRQLPGWMPISVSGYHMRDAGASREMEIGFTLALAREYLSRCQRRGLDAGTIASRMTWFLSASAQPLQEAAKFRAARELWANLLAAEFGVEDDTVRGLRIIAYTLGGEMKPHEINNNAVRITLSALGAVLGRVQTIFCSSIDEALGLPTEENALLSIRTQEILLEEAGLADFIDPLAGTDAVVQLTDQIALEAQDWDRRVAEAGGIVDAIVSGAIRSWIDESAWRSELASRERPAAADHPANTASALRIFAADPAVEVERRARVSGWKAARPAAKVERAVDRLRQAVDSRVNLVGPLIEAFLEDVTMGESMRLLVERHGAAPGREHLWRL